jgi:hypothetical protein
MMNLTFSSANASKRYGCALLLFGAVLSQSAWGQVTWQTTKTTNNTKNTGNCTLDNSSLRVKAYPGYLDVEEDATVRTGGTVGAANDANTLEITATFTLPAGSVVTGALLWDGNRVLQAKLLDKFKADSIYEDLVDRDSVPPPRPVDPLILERTGTNTYRLRIYPVALNATRRFRLRYQLPPRVTAEGFEMRLQGAITPLFSPGTSTVSTTFEGRGGVTKMVYVEGGLRRDVTLPRTLFVPRSALTASTAASSTNSTRVLPVDTLRQVQVKTSFGTGTYAGHYLNLYASVGEDLLRALNQRVEVVVFWKWHNVGAWTKHPEYAWEAQSQAYSLKALYGQLGLPGNRIGLLHDDGYNPPRTFATAGRTEAPYRQAKEYLESMQGSYINDFLANLQFSGGKKTNAITASKARFRQNMQIVKTLYSPEQGVTRHLILVSAGPDSLNTVNDMNAAFDSIFQDRPVSLSPMKGRSFNQAGFDFFVARQARPIPGSVASLDDADVPGFPSMSLIATIRNAAKAYDFTIACTGGVGIACGTLEFHGKSQAAWKDTVEWEAYHANGSLIGTARTAPALFQATQDTGTALLWAGSAAPFSETIERPLGPTYGFVDPWASLLALERDSTSAPVKAAYADTGVPRAGPIPDYVGPAPGTTPVLGTATNSLGAWRVERIASGQLLIRVPKLAAGLSVEISLHDLTGRRLESAIVVSTSGELRWKPVTARSGTYLLRLKGPGIEGARAIML